MFQPVKPLGGEVQRVGQVDHVLAGELGAVGLDDAVDGGERHGENDEVTGQRSAADLIVRYVVDGAAAVGEHATDGLGHVAGADDGEAGHLGSSRSPERPAVCLYLQLTP